MTVQIKLQPVEQILKRFEKVTNECKKDYMEEPECKRLKDIAYTQKETLGWVLGL